MSEISIEIHGERSNDAQVVGEVLEASDALWRAVCEEIMGDPDAVRLVISGLRFQCDGCQRTEPSLPKDWIKRGADDLCPDCVAALDGVEGDLDRSEP